MATLPESNSVESIATESDTNVSVATKIVDVHPLAFTIEFNDQKVDETRKSKVHERLSAFSLKHRRNPSLPDFGTVKNAKTSPPNEKLPSQNSHVPIIGKGNQKSGKTTEIQWKSTALKAVKNCELRSSIVLRSLEVNGARENFLKHLKNIRRNSLNDIDSKLSCQNNMPSSVEYQLGSNGEGERNTDLGSRSPTVSEAGTYTLDKEDENAESEADKTQIIITNNDDEDFDESKKIFRKRWINDWVREVEKQSMRNSLLDEPQTRNSGSGHSSPGTSKIPSPINTLSRKVKLRGVKSGEEKQYITKVNGSTLHRRSSSLSAKVSFVFFTCIFYCFILQF